MNSTDDPSSKRGYMGLRSTLAAILLLLTAAVVGVSGLGISLKVGIVAVLLLILVTGFCVAAEFAVVELRRSRVRQLIDEGHPTALSVMRLLSRRDQLIDTVQVWITLSAILAGAVGAESMGESIQAYMAQRGIQNAGWLSTGIIFGVTFLVTFATVVLGETTPKRLVLADSERFLLTFGRLLEAFMLLSWPVVWSVTHTTGLITKLLGVHSVRATHISEEEIKYIVEESEEEGVLEEEEKEMIHSIFKFTDTVAREVMVPRTEMVTAGIDAALSELVSLIIQKGHSRIPIWEGNVDNIVGVIHAKDLLKHLSSENGGFDIRSVLRPAMFIPENKRVDELLAEFKRTKQQLAIVVDEYGGTSGVVSVEDLLEEIVGDIFDEYDQVAESPEIVQESDRVWVLDARVAIDDLNEDLGLDLPTEEFDTVGGLVFGLLGKPAAEGDEASSGRARFKVLEIQGRRVAKLRLEIEENGRQPAASEERLPTKQ